MAVSVYHLPQGYGKTVWAQRKQEKDPENVKHVWFSRAFKQVGESYIPTPAVFQDMGKRENQLLIVDEILPGWLHQIDLNSWAEEFGMEYWPNIVFLTQVPPTPEQTPADVFVKLLCTWDY